MGSIALVQRLGKTRKLPQEAQGWPLNLNDLGGSPGRRFHRCVSGYATQHRHFAELRARLKLADFQLRVAPVRSDEYVSRAVNHDVKRIAAPITLFDYSLAGVIGKQPQIRSYFLAVIVAAIYYDLEVQLVVIVSLAG